MISSSTPEGLPLPFYYRIRMDLVHRIATGALPSGSFLPTERDLGEQYQASRTTIRQAVGQLIAEGLVAPIRGKGIRVLGIPVRQRFVQLISFTELVRQQQLEPGIHDIRIHEVRASKAVGPRLDLKVEAQVVEVRRLRSVNGQPVAYQVSYLPVGIGRRLSQARLLTLQSLYLVLEEIGVVISRAEDELLARNATREEAAHLAIQPHAAVLVLERVLYAADGSRVEFASSVMRGDRYRYVASLERSRVSGHPATTQVLVGI